MDIFFDDDTPLPPDHPERIAAAERYLAEERDRLLLETLERIARSAIDPTDIGLPDSFALDGAKVSIADSGIVYFAHPQGRCGISQPWDWLERDKEKMR